MARAGSQFVWGVVLVVLFAGCKTTPQPVLKPTAQPEVLTKPPQEARFNQSQYPDVAFRDMNSQFRKPLDGNGSIVPTRGNMAGGGMMPAGGGMSPGGMGSGLR